MSQQTSEHPLMRFPTSSIQSWTEWLELWNREDLPVEFRVSLLHVGLDIGIGIMGGYREERIIFYLGIADGYANDANFRGEDDGDYERNRSWRSALDRDIRLPSQGRQAVAEKAFRVLSTKWFKEAGNWEEIYDWRDTLSNAGLVQALFWFLRPNEFGRVRNIVDHRTTKDARQSALRFVLKFCKYAWRYQRFGDKAHQEFLRAERPRIVEILSGLGHARELLRREYAESIEKEDLAKLEEIAMSNKLWGLPYPLRSRQVEIVDEAVYSGSSTAEILAILRIRLHQKERFERMAELEKARRQADEELAELTSGDSGS